MRGLPARRRIELAAGQVQASGARHQVELQEDCVGVATRREGGGSWSKVEDVRAECKVRKCTEQQGCARQTRARKVRTCRAAVNGSADLENSLLAHVGGPGSASPSQAAPATPSSVADLLRQILRRHGGSFAFQDIPDERKNIGSGEETAYSQLNQRVGASAFMSWAGDPAPASEIGDESCQSGIDYFDSDENIL